MALISNISLLQGMGVFADRDARSVPLNLRRFNLVYGFNGSGKSTLSRLFSCLESGSLHSHLPPGSAFSFRLDDNAEYGHPAKLSGLERKILVFNGDFIEKNLKWNLGKANPVFFIGAEQAEAAAALETLETQIEKLIAQQVPLEVAKAAAEKAFTVFKRDCAKQIFQRLHSGNRRYEAPAFAKDYDQWSGEELQKLTDDELKAAEDICRLSAPMPKVKELSIESSAIPTAYQFVIEVCEQTLSSVTLNEVQKYPEMVLWLNQGRQFHESHALKNCLLCGSEFPEGRQATLRGALDSKIDQFIERLDRTAARLQAVIMSLRSAETGLPSADSLNSEQSSPFKEPKAHLSEALHEAIRHLVLLEGVLTTKRNKPASPADISSLPASSEVEQNVANIDQLVKDLNSLISAHNINVDDFAAHQNRAEESIRKHFVAELKKEFAEHLQAKTVATEKLDKLLADIADAKVKADELRQRIRTHGPAATAINRLIESYLGHRELTIHAVEEGYELHRHGEILRGLPSEGEKTAIAIAYFISTIESDGKKLKDLIVVVDDPVSSLDTKALNYACALVRNRLSNASQLFILTHNQQCMNEFRKTWKNKQKPADDKDPTATFLFIDVALRAGQRRSATLVEMPALLREYDSEYHFLFSHVLKFSEAANEYSYMMPHVLRRVLDIFLAFKCPGSSGLVGKIEELCGQYQDLDRTRLAALERLSQVESHSDNLDDLISFSSMTLEETRDASNALLAMMEHVDSRHFGALRRICR